MSTPNGPVAIWSKEDKIKETLLRSKKHLGPVVGQQIDVLISPENLAILVVTLVIWGGSHFVGVGEVVDVVLLLVGAAMIGPSIVTVVENLMVFGKCIVATSDAELERSAKAFADAVVLGGITVVMAVLLRKGAKSVPARPAGVPLKSWLKAKVKQSGLPDVGADPHAGSLWSKVTVTGDASLVAGEGSTTAFGDIFYSTQGSVTEQMLVLLHEKVHAALSPRFGILRTLRARIAIAGYSRSVFLKYLEEAMAESFAQLRVNGFTGIIQGIRFPLTNGYVSIAQLAAEGNAIGAIIIGAQRFTVSLLGGPETWNPQNLPPKQGAEPIVLDDEIITGGFSVTVAPGQSLSLIAGAKYSDVRLWPLIWDLNRAKIGENPNRVKAGLVLTLLPLDRYTATQIADAHRRSPTWKNYPH